MPGRRGGGGPKSMAGRYCPRYSLSGSVRVWLVLAAALFAAPLPRYSALLIRLRQDFYGAAAGEAVEGVFVGVKRHDVGG